MATSERPTPVSSQEFERLVRAQLRESYEHYQAAAEQYRRMLDERSRGVAPDPDVVLALARRAESEAQVEYTRVLRIFTDLVLRGESPAEQGSAALEDV